MRFGKKCAVSIAEYVDKREPDTTEQAGQASRRGRFEMRLSWHDVDGVRWGEDSSECGVLWATLTEGTLLAGG